LERKIASGLFIIFATLITWIVAKCKMRERNIQFIQLLPKFLVVNLFFEQEADNV